MNLNNDAFLSLFNGRNKKDVYSIVAYLKNIIYDDDLLRVKNRLAQKMPQFGDLIKIPSSTVQPSEAHHEDDRCSNRKTFMIILLIALILIVVIIVVYSICKRK